MTAQTEFRELQLCVKGQESKLDDMKSDLKIIREALMGDPTDQTKPGMIIRIDRLERSEATRTKLLWVLVTAFGGLLADRLKGFF